MAKTKKITFGQVRDIPKDAAESRIIPFVLSTPQRDRHHTILNQANWHLDNFRANPVIGYMHNLYGDLCNAPDPDDVLGSGVDARVEDMNGILCLTDSGRFDPPEINLKGDKVFRKLMLGSLRAVSVGFSDLGKGRWGQGEEAAEKENETYYFEGQELMEWSVVNIPSNAGAGKRANEIMRNQAHAAIMYAFRELGKNFRLSQIESMRVRDILDLLDGKDIELHETDPDKVRQLLMDEMARKAGDHIIEKQQQEMMKRIIEVK